VPIRTIEATTTKGNKTTKNAILAAFCVVLGRGGRKHICPNDLEIFLHRFYAGSWYRKISLILKLVTQNIIDIIPAKKVPISNFAPNRIHC
jgi:hypothetical protein